MENQFTARTWYLMPEILGLGVGASYGYEENHKFGIVCTAKEVWKIYPI